MQEYTSNYGYKEECRQVPLTFPPQQQDRQPGFEYLMEPKPVFDNPHTIGTGKLNGKTALITGGDSGIGRAVAVAFAKEGANVSIAYFDEHEDAEETKCCVESYGAKCLLISGDLKEECFCHKAVRDTVDAFGSLDVLVNNAAVQYAQPGGIGDITAKQLDDTFRTNIYSMFYLTQAALPCLEENSCIINTTSVTAYKGNELLIDYSSTKGAIVTFTRALARSLMDRKIRVNGVAPGPIWTPLQPASYDADYISTFGASTPMKRAGQPAELAPTYVYLACDDSSYVTGQILHVNGGEAMDS